MAISYEDIRPGMTKEQFAEAAKAIREALPTPSVTVLPGLQGEADKITAGATDEQLRKAQGEPAKDGPPAEPDLSGKNDAEKKVLVEKYLGEKDAYYAGLMNRPTGSAYTKTESSALAGEALRALRESGIRV